MNTAHWHLLLNHLPIIGTLLGILILLSGLILSNNIMVKRTALGVFIFSALMAIPAYLTGEGAEDVVEKLPGVGENIIENHEDLGKLFLIAIEVLGVLALITLIADWIQNKSAAVLYMIVLFAGFGAMYLAKQAGTSGGEIRHTEIRNDFQPAVNVAGKNNAGESTEEKDDD